MYLFVGRGEREGRGRRTINLQKPVLFLLVLGDIDGVDFVGNTQFLEGYAQFLAVGRSGRVPIPQSQPISSVYFVLECCIE